MTSHTSVVPHVPNYRRRALSELVSSRPRIAFAQQSRTCAELAQFEYMASRFRLRHLWLSLHHARERPLVHRRTLHSVVHHRLHRVHSNFLSNHGLISVTLARLRSAKGVTARHLTNSRGQSSTLDALYRNSTFLRFWSSRWTMRLIWLARRPPTQGFLLR